jgi:predicted transcriptional regulator
MLHFFFIYERPSSLMQDRVYERKKQTILRFIKKHGKVDHTFILNEVDIDYDTLMKILSELRREGSLG